MIFFFAFDAEMFDGGEPAAHQKNVWYTADISLLEIFMSSVSPPRKFHHAVLVVLESISPIQILCV